MPVEKRYKVGRTKWCKGGWIEFSFYAVGDKPRSRIAMTLVDERTRIEGPLMSCCVNFPELTPREGHVWIKDWSENEGLLNALVAADIGMVTGRSHATGFVVAHELKLKGTVYAQARRVIDKLLPREADEPSQ